MIVLQRDSEAANSLVISPVARDEKLAVPSAHTMEVAHFGILKHEGHTHVRDGGCLLLYGDSVVSEALAFNAWTNRRVEADGLL